MVRVVTPVGERDAVDGQPLFVNFVNTLHWYEGVPIELFGELPSANAWLAEQSLPALTLEPSVARLRSLREDARQVVLAIVNGEPPDRLHLGALTRALSRPAAHLVLRESPNETPHLAVDVTSDPATLIAFRVALSLATFLESGDSKRLKLCANPGCGFAFVDTSMNATRRWCFMRYCGNRVKVRTFRTRQRGASESVSESASAAGSS